MYSSDGDMEGADDETSIPESLKEVFGINKVNVQVVKRSAKGDPYARGFSVVKYINVAQVCIGFDDGVNLRDARRILAPRAGFSNFRQGRNEDGGPALYFDLSEDLVGSLYDLEIQPDPFIIELLIEHGCPEIYDFGPVDSALICKCGGDDTFEDYLWGILRESCIEVPATVREEVCAKMASPHESQNPTS